MGATPTAADLDQLVREYRNDRPRSAELHRTATDLFAARGATHFARARSPFRPYIVRASGARKWDVDGHEYVDYVMGHGSLLLGHGHPEVLRAMQEQVALGVHYGDNHPLEVEWAGLIRSMMPAAERLEYFASGQEANELGVRLGRAVTGRKRVLNEAELAEIWRACGDDDLGRIVRLLILTGQRRGEIADLQWAEINTAAAQIELPPPRTKNGLPHLVPISDEAAAMLVTAPRWQDREHVFGEGPRRGFQGWSKAKAELDKAIGEARKKAGNMESMPHWTIHDIRRSFVTHMGERGFAEPHVIEAIVNHVSGVKGGVAGVYNKAQYLDERRKALKAWGAHVARLVRAAKVELAAPSCPLPAAC